MTYCRYSEGAGLAVVGEGIAVLFPGGDRACAIAVAEQMAVAPDPAQVLQAITAGAPIGVRELPDFVLLAWQQTGLQVLIRGAVEVRVHGTVDAVVDGRDVIAWREQTVIGATWCEIGDIDPTSDSVLPLTSGVVRAGALLLARSSDDLDVVAGPADSAAVDDTELEPAAAAQEVPGEPVGHVAIEPEPSHQPTPAPEPEAADGDGAVEEVDVHLAPAGAATLGGTTWGATQADDVDALPELPPSPPPAPTGAEDAGYAHLFGATQARTVEEAAVREPEEAHEPSDVSEPPDSLIHDGETIGPAALAELRRARGIDGGAVPPPPAPSGHGVLARVCLSGHSNPPERGECWICGRQVVGDATRLARPPLGAIRVSNGEVITLDGSYVVGRRPKVTRTSGEAPRVLTVPSPQGEVSGSHLAIRLEDWHVLAVDLDSSNGTMLFREGQEPKRLDPHVPVLLHSGDVVDLGDGAVLAFEDLP